MTTFRYYGLAAAILALVALSEQVESTEPRCSERTHSQDASCDSSQPPASLLQKAARRHHQIPQCPLCEVGNECYCTQESCICVEKGLIAEEGLKPDASISDILGHDDSLSEVTVPTCSGTEAQGRCWYLSAQGANCADTCAKYGRTFAFALPDSLSMPMGIVPILVGEQPDTKNKAWAALECYVNATAQKNEPVDRYHTANANAAKDHTNDQLGIFSYDQCQLACPCGVALTAQSDKCKWKQAPACAAKFMYKGVEYAGCATADSGHEDKSWCQHAYNTSMQSPGTPQDWSFCEYECDSPPVASSCEWVPASGCVKEFDYKGARVVGCTASDQTRNTPWCSNSFPYEGSWNYCDYSCNGHVHTMAAPAVGGPTPPTDKPVCTWQQKQECQATFEYRGVNYSGCINVDHPTPWCSHNRVHKGDWSTCTKVCSSPVPPQPLPPQPVPSQPVPSQPVPITVTEDPCTRHPEAENDEIGATVTLDEPGYNTAALSHSPINMKRFICRVIAKLNCKVNDGTALIGFVPFYYVVGEGTIVTETYAHLESELSILCNAGGKWVTPIGKL